MLIYNITYCIDSSLLKEWDAFVATQLRPFFDAHENVKECLFFKVLTTEPGASPTFCFQLFMKSINDIRLFKETEANLKSMVYMKFQDSCLSFETVLKKIEWDEWDSGVLDESLDNPVFDFEK